MFVPDLSNRAEGFAVYRKSPEMNNFLSAEDLAAAESDDYKSEMLGALLAFCEQCAFVIDSIAGLSWPETGFLPETQVEGVYYNHFRRRRYLPRDVADENCGASRALCQRDNSDKNEEFKLFYLGRYAGPHGPSDEKIIALLEEKRKENLLDAPFEGFEFLDSFSLDDMGLAAWNLDKLALRDITLMPRDSGHIGISENGFCDYALICDRYLTSESIDALAEISRIVAEKKSRFLDLERLDDFNDSENFDSASFKQMNEQVYNRYKHFEETCDSSELRTVIFFYDGRICAIMRGSALTSEAFLTVFHNYRDAAELLNEIYAAKDDQFLRPSDLAAEKRKEDLTVAPQAAESFQLQSLFDLLSPEEAERCRSGEEQNGAEKPNSPRDNFCELNAACKVLLKQLPEKAAKAYPAYTQLFSYDLNQHPGALWPAIFAEVLLKDKTLGLLFSEK